jgi:cytochrome c oxidase cbb3-type subunit IV
MYKDILRTMAGIEVFPLLSLLLFVTVFAVVLVWAGRLDGPRLSRYSRLPLDDSQTDNTDAAAGDMARQGVKS